MNVCLSCVDPERDKVLYLDAKNSHKENTDIVIIEGLSCMDYSDFNCWRNKSEVRVENGVSFNWASKAIVKIPNAYLHFRERSRFGLMEFYLNGFADTAIGVMLDATQTANPESERQSRDIDAHLQRFCAKEYTRRRFVLLNFAMNSDDIVLPMDASAHDKVYTFVRSTNTLYRGVELLRSPAIPDFSGSSRSFSTIFRTGCARGTKAAQFSFLGFLTTGMKRL